MEKTEHEDGYISEKEVSSITGIPRSTLRNHRFKNVGIPYSKVGKRKVEYHISDVEDFMKIKELIESDEPLLAEQIAHFTDHKDGEANIRAINEIYRRKDQSHLYPIFGKFNATERAIRRVGRFRRWSEAIYGLEYCYALEHEISQITNSA